MQTIFDVSLPVFAIVLCGFLAGKYKVIDKSMTKGLNDFVYYFALPALLFLSLAKAPVNQLANWPFVGATLGGILASFLLAIVLAKLLFRQQRPTLALYGMAASYGTTGYMGIPLIIAAFGPAAAVPASLATLLHNIPVITIVIITFASSQAVSQPEQGGKGQGITLFKGIVRAIVLNPLNIAVLLGIIVAFFHLSLPKSVDAFTQLLANAAGSTALFAIGLGLVAQGNQLQQAQVSKAEVSMLVALKIIFQPLVTIFLLTYILHTNALWSTVAVLMSALPVGAGVYVFALRYEKLVAQVTMAILVSMILSVVSISVLLLASHTPIWAFH